MREFEIFLEGTQEEFVEKEVSGRPIVPSLTQTILYLRF